MFFTQHSFKPPTSSSPFPELSCLALRGHDRRVPGLLHAERSWDANCAIFHPNFQTFDITKIFKTIQTTFLYIFNHFFHAPWHQEPMEFSSGPTHSVTAPRKFFCSRQKSFVMNLSLHVDDLWGIYFDIFCLEKMPSWSFKNAVRQRVAMRHWDFSGWRSNCFGRRVVWLTHNAHRSYCIVRLTNR